MLDCIVGYHMNRIQCGISKFNHHLAAEMGLPLISVFDERLLGCHEPLISIRVNEFTPSDLAAFASLWDQLVARGRSVQLFLHGYGDSALEQRMVQEAATVFCGNSEMLAEVQRYRPDAVETWCPGMIESTDRFLPADLTIFTFGMAHKVNTRYYGRLRDLLDATGQSYTLYVSSALHENTSFDESFSAAFEEIRDIFNGRAHFLGFLSDDGVYNYLLNSTYFVAFFDKGVRANNTSVNAAMDAGCAVITNLDGYSPPGLTHLRTVIDIDQATALPIDPAQLAALRDNARSMNRASLSWARLATRLTAPLLGQIVTGAVKSASTFAES